LVSWQSLQKTLWSVMKVNGESLRILLSHVAECEALACITI